jgi:hypothetical protein
MPYSSIRPGRVWLDTEGKRIQAHGGSIFFENDTFYWYGENKEKTLPGNGIWHWGVRAYSSRDLYNWKDEGLILAPDETNGESPVHPSKSMDRPHILYNQATKKYVMWIKIMNKLYPHDHRSSQFMTVATSDRFLGPYTIEKTFHPLGMNSGTLILCGMRPTEKPISILSGYTRSLSAPTSPKTTWE